jgi:hypothetical protein
MSSKKEVWKLISFQGKKPSISYAVSNQGRFGVMDEKGHVEVRTFKPQSGGYRYNYKVDGASKALFVYKEVAKAFLKKPSPKHTLVIRKDHNYLNDKVDNLKWVTPKEHKEHVTFSPNSVLARKKRAITKSYTAKVFNEKSIKEVKKLIWDPKRKLTFKQIAEKFGVSEMQIYRIKTGELWFHVKVDNEPENKKYKENLQNISFQEKKAEKENAAKEKSLATRLAQQKKNAERRAKVKADKDKKRKLIEAERTKKRKEKALRSKNYAERLEKAKKKRDLKTKKKQERLSKKDRKKLKKNKNKKKR